MQIKIKEMRQKREITQHALAKMCGIDQRTMSTYEIGKVHPRLDALVNIAKALNCTLDDLVDM